jgi:hypothetical protein
MPPWSGTEEELDDLIQFLIYKEKNNEYTEAGMGGRLRP